MQPKTRRGRSHRSGILAGVGLVGLLWLTPPQARADGVDLVLDEAGATIGELATQFSLGPLDVQAEHQEYLAYLTDSAESSSADALTRQSRFTAYGRVEVDAGVDLPFSFEANYRNFASGRHDLDTALRSGVALPGLEITNDLALEQRFSEDTEPSHSLDGIVSVGFDWLGARHEGRVDYDLMPVTEATLLAFSSSWTLGDAIEAAIDFSHRPLDSLSEAQLALNRSYGPFSLGSDFAANNQGGYTLGISLSLSLTPASPGQEWRLSNLLSAYEARRQASIQDSFGILAITEEQ